MDCGIFNVLTAVNACHCTLGRADTVRESAPNGASGKGKNLSPHWGTEAASAAACRSDATPT